MIEIKEALVSGYKPLKNKGHSVTLTIKQEDLSKPDRELLEKLWTDGGIVAGGLNIITETETKPKKSTQHLAVVMQKYCDVHGIEVEEEKKKIYVKFNVSSRAELQETDILNLIESYSLGLYE